MKNSFSLFLVGLVSHIPLVVSGLVGRDAISSSWQPRAPMSMKTPGSLLYRDDAPVVCKNACKQPCTTNLEFRDKKDNCRCKPCEPGFKHVGNWAECKKDKKGAKLRGNCPIGSLLDPAEPGQDEKTPNPVCILDESAQCKPDLWQQTREPGIDGVLRCGEHKGKIPKCDKKKEYLKVVITADEPGVAMLICTPMR
jgi:hypothetical protein